MPSLPRVFALAFAGGLAMAQAHAVTIYKWVDENGVTHYAQNPPPGLERDRITTIGGQSTEWVDPDDAAADGNDDDEVADAEGDGPTSIEEFCAQIQRQLEVIETVDDVRVETEDGQLRRLDDQAREQRRETLQSQIRQNC